MKAKLYIGLMAAGMLSVSAAHAQLDRHGYNDNGGTVVINNYYDDYDYFYASRISRFHRSYSRFDYYAPLFTDTYWYSYQPFTWGVSIYGGGFGGGFGYASPFYRSYDPFWGDPYFSSSYYWGYDPFMYRPWYTPGIVHINLGYSWPRYYWGYNGHNHFHNPHHYEYAMYHNAYRNNNSSHYYSSRYATPGNDYRRNAPSSSSEVYNSSSRRGTHDAGRPASDVPVRTDRRGSVTTPSAQPSGNTSRNSAPGSTVNSRRTAPPAVVNRSSETNTQPADAGNRERVRSGSVNKPSGQMTEQPRRSTTIYNNQAPRTESPSRRSSGTVRSSGSTPSSGSVQPRSTVAAPKSSGSSSGNTSRESRSTDNDKSGKRR
jgi:hypothetical protein